MRVHNRVLRSRLPVHFSLLIPHSRPSLHRNPDTAVIFIKVILITVKTTVGSKYGTITIRKHTLINYVSKDVKSHNSLTSIATDDNVSFCLSLTNFDSTFPVGTFRNCACLCCVLILQYFIKT